MIWAAHLTELYGGIDCLLRYSSIARREVLSCISASFPGAMTKPTFSVLLGE